MQVSKAIFYEEQTDIEAYWKRLCSWEVVINLDLFSESFDPQNQP